MYHFGLIGYPIAHSMSPFIHQQFLKTSGIEGDYSIIEINPENNFEEAVIKLRNREIDGFNITVPYKQKMLDYLDEVDTSAQAIGAVNTVLHQDGRLIGYNTDGKGYVRSLENGFPELKSNKDYSILILGAGGAAKGIYHGLQREGYHNITVANRTIEKAEAIAGISRAITMEQAEETAAAFKVIIQTTSVGMKPNIDQAIISLQNVKKGTIVSDIVYQPIMTKFLREAKAQEALTHKGHTMLLYQAQYAFEIWTGTCPETAGLDTILQRKLEG